MLFIVVIQLHTVMAEFNPVYFPVISTGKFSKLVELYTEQQASFSERDKQLLDKRLEVSLSHVYSKHLYRPALDVLGVIRPWATLQQIDLDQLRLHQLGVEQIAGNSCHLAIALAYWLNGVSCLNERIIATGALSVNQAGDTPRVLSVDLIPEKLQLVYEDAQRRYQTHSETFKNTLFFIPDQLMVNGHTIAANTWLERDAPMSASQLQRYGIRVIPVADLKQALSFLPKRQTVQLKIYTSLAEEPSPKERTHLLMLLDRVNEYWIEGFLKKSLYNDVLISLGKTVDDAAVETPWHKILELPHEQQQLTGDSPIDEIFDATGYLLILGEPGSGKTTTLLQLAQKLLHRAKLNPKERIPVVFNLSSWKSKLSIENWIIDYLCRYYSVPKKIAQTWIEKNYIIPLLDGFDEVKADEHLGCVLAINSYIEAHDTSGLVVCCRNREYQGLATQLQCNGAIRINGLQANQVDQYLKYLGANFSSLRTAVNSDNSLQEISESPLMLNIMSITYQSVSSEKPPKYGLTIEECKEQIFDAYVNKMLERKSGQNFSKENVVNWVSYLANTMKKNAHSVFFVENMQPTLLGGSFLYRFLIFIASYSFCAALFFFVFLHGFCDYNLNSSFFLFSISPVIIGVSYILYSFFEWCSKVPLKITFLLICIGFLVLLALSELYPGKDWLKVWAFFWSFMLKTFVYSKVFFWLSNGIAKFLVRNVFSLDVLKIQSFETITWSFESVRDKGLFNFSMFGVAGGILLTPFGLAYFGLGVFCFGFIGIVFSGIKFETMLNKTRPNYGVILAARNSVVFFAVALLFLTPIIYLDFDQGSKKFVVFIWILYSYILCMSMGLGSVIKHYSLRISLCYDNKMPLNLIKFLDLCEKLIFLKRVGGGYVFVHRLFLEHMANKIR